MALLADIASGNTNWADILFLVALILFLIAGFIAYQAQAIWVSVFCLGLAALSGAWLVL